MAVRQRLSWVVTTTGPAALTRWLIRACPAQEARSRPRPGPRPPAGTPVPEIISALLPPWRALPPAPARSAGPGRVPDRKVPACSATGPGTGASAENRASHPTPGYPYSLDRAGPRRSRPVSSRLIADATQGGRDRVPARSLPLLPHLVDLRQPGIRHGPPGGRQAAGLGYLPRRVVHLGDQPVVLGVPVQAAQRADEVLGGAAPAAGVTAHDHVGLHVGHQLGTAVRSAGDRPIRSSSTSASRRLTRVFKRCV